MIHPKVDVSRLSYHGNERALIFPAKFADLWIYVYKQFCEGRTAQIRSKNELTHPMA